MSPVTRYLVVVLIRLLLIVAAGWFAFAPDALGDGAPLASRLALVLAFLLLSVLFGELDRLRTHFGLLLAALRSGGGAAGTTTRAASEALDAALRMGPGLEGAAAEPKRDDRASVDILIKALSTRDADTRARVHAHLRRLTGQELPADPKAWASWWAGARADFPR